MWRKVAYWLPVFFWMAVIFGFSAQPTLHASPFQWQDFLIKKTAHFCEYFILATLIYYALRKTTRLSKTSCLIFTLFSSISYAASDEFHQSFVLGRESRVRDVLIDSFGASTSAYLLRYLHRLNIL